MGKPKKYKGANGEEFTHENTHSGPKYALVVPPKGRLSAAREYVAATKDYALWGWKTLTASPTPPPSALPVAKPIVS
eukprot:5218693-Pyramimonas_sp.AAC.1